MMERKAPRTQLEIAGSAITIQHLLQCNVRRLRINALGIETNSFSVTLPLEIVIPLLLEILSDF